MRTLARPDTRRAGGPIAGMLWAAVFGCAALVLPSLPASADDRFTVCSITINSDDEIRTFRARLPASEFRFVELTTLGATSASGGDDWFDGVCRSGVRCDVLVLSAHFGNTWAGNYGTTFAGSSGMSLALDELERQRCEDTCSGVLGSPLEVFLFGCKTLADDSDAVLDPSDAALLGRYGFSADTAKQALDEARNRGEDTSSLRRMRYVFGGVPHVYGFTDVAPSGAHVAPLLERYLSGVGDYAEHLRGLRSARGGAPFAPNQTLARALEPTCLAQTDGLDRAGSEYARRSEACYLRDERRPLDARLDRMAQMLDGGRFWPSLAAVDSLLHQAHATPTLARGSAIGERLRGHDAGRAAALQLVERLDDPVLRLEVLRVAGSLGWISDADALPAYRRIVTRLLAPPVYGEARDTICGLRPAVLGKLDLRAEDIPAAVYRDEFGIQALACLRPADERVRERLALSLSDSREWIARLAAVALKGSAGPGERTRQSSP